MSPSRPTPRNSNQGLLCPEPPRECRGGDAEEPRIDLPHSLLECTCSFVTPTSGPATPDPDRHHVGCGVAESGEGGQEMDAMP